MFTCLTQSGLTFAQYPSVLSSKHNEFHEKHVRGLRLLGVGMLHFKAAHRREDSLAVEGAKTKCDDCLMEMMLAPHRGS